MSHLKRAAQIAAICVVAACAGDAGDPVGLGDELHVISDAAHTGAVPGFYFLPPMVAQPTVSGTFDAGLQPTVQICELTVSGCGATVASFAFGTGGNNVRVEAAAQHYIANWHDTKNLDPAKFYRIRVFSGSVELGFVDVDVVANGSQLGGVNTSQYVPLKAGSSLAIKFRIETGIVGQIVVTPAADTVDVGQTAQFTASQFDLHGNPISGPAVTWSTGNNAIATVNASGLATGVAVGTTSVTASLPWVSGSASITVEQPNIPPVARADTFQAIGNVTIPVSAPGVLGNDTDADSDPLAAVPGTIPTSGGGSVVLSADGSFTYLSAAGFIGGDSFSYTATDGVDSATATVTLQVGTRVWYASNTAPAPGDGRDGSPFARLKDAETASAAGETVFVLAGDGSTTGRDEGFIFKAGQSLIGQGIPSAVTVTLNGTPLTLLAPGGTPRVTRATAGTSIQLATGNTLRGLALASTGGAGIAGSGFGTFTANAARVAAVGGPAVDLQNGVAAVALDSLSATGSAGDGLSLNAVTGAFDAPAGSISASSGRGVAVSGGNGTVGFGGEISGSGVHAALVSGRTGGSVTLNGPITDALGGIRVENNTSGAIAFTGPSKWLSTGSANGVTAINNGSATLTFAGGGLDVTTTTGIGFSVQSGGTVTVTGAGNRVTSAGGVAVSVVNTTIGAAGLTFRSVSATGGGNGIVLASTGSLNGLQVTGDGATAGSGGTISGSVGGDGTGAGIGVNLNGVRNVSLAYMQLNDFDNFAVFGVAVNGFTLQNSVVAGNNGTSAAADEGSIAFAGLTGSASIATVSISGGVEDNFRVVNGSGTLDRITFTGVSFGSNGLADGDAGLELVAHGSAVMKATVQGSTFSSARGNTLRMNLSGSATGDLVLSGSTFTNTHPAIVGGGGGVVVDAVGTAQLTYLVSGNSFRDARGTALAIAGSSGTPSLTGTVDNNTVGVASVANSGSQQGSGIAVVGVGGTVHTTALTGNQVRQYNNQGILLQLGDASLGGSGALNATVTGNTIANPGTAPIAKNGLHLNAGTTSVDAHQVCLNASGNSLTGSGSGGAAGTDIRLRQRFLTTVRLPGYAGANNNNLAVQAFVQAANGVTPTALAQNAVATGGGGFVGGAGCPTP